MNDWMLIAIFGIVIVFALFVIPRWRINRAVRQVVRIFRDNNALDTKTAKTVDELGLRPQRIIDGLLKSRDYKPYALTNLIKADIARETKDGRLYLSEGKLREAGFES